MMHQHQDIMGRYIQIGDYIVFPMPGYGSGSGMAPLGIGEVIRATKGGLTVRYLNEYYEYKKQDIGHYETTNDPYTDRFGNPQKDWQGNIRYKQKWVVDGQEDMEPVHVKSTAHRYFIVEKP